MPTLRTLRVLDLCAGLIVLASAAIALWPLSATPKASESMTKRASGRANASVGNVTDRSSDAATVTNANILSSSRRAPSVRYVSPENAPTEQYTLPPAFAPGTPTASDSTGNDRDAVPALYGIVNTDGVPRALVRLADDDDVPRLLRAGDKRGAYTIESISSDRVIISKGGSRQTLRLRRAVPADSLQGRQ